MAEPFRDFIDIAKVNGASLAGLHTRGFEAFFQTMHAQVTLFNDLSFSVELKCPERAGLEAGQATNAEFTGYEHNAIMPLGYCPFWTCLNTRRISAMQTGHGDKLHHELSVSLLGSHNFYTDPFDPYRELVFLFAG